jgi:hypothetical protein
MCAGCISASALLSTPRRASPGYRSYTFPLPGHKTVALSGVRDSHCQRGGGAGGSRGQLKSLNSREAKRAQASHTSRPRHRPAPRCNPRDARPVTGSHVPACFDGGAFFRLYSPANFTLQQQQEALFGIHAPCTRVRTCDVTVQAQPSGRELMSLTMQDAS